MPRDSSGTYTLPAGNPTVAFTTITTAWANPTMADIGNELTNSLDRSGRGGMLAPFRIFDGSISQPGLGFLNEVGIGLWRESSGLMHIVNSGTRVITVKPSEASFPFVASFFGENQFRVSGSKNWLIQNLAGLLTFKPSTAIDGVTWDATKQVTANPDTGVWNFAVAPTIAGVPVGSGYLPITGGTLTGPLNIADNTSNAFTLTRSSVTARSYIQLIGSAGEWILYDATGAASAITVSIDKTIKFRGSVVIGEGGSYGAGSIYSDPTFGMSFTARIAGSQAAFAWFSSAGVERMSMLDSGEVGIGVAATAGTKVWIDGTVSTQLEGLRVTNESASGTLKYMKIYLGAASAAVPSWIQTGILESGMDNGLVLSAVSATNGKIVFTVSNARATALEIAANKGLIYYGRIAQSAAVAHPTGTTLDWAVTPTQLQMAAGETINGFANARAGEIKRIWVLNGGAITISAGGAGTFTWAAGAPVWGATGTFVTIICGSPTLYYGTTLPI